MIPVDPHDCFCDLAEEGAALGLLGLMTGLSEESWCAAWMMGMEYQLWEAKPGDRFGMNDITERQAALLRLLSEECDGWWVWQDDADDPIKSGPRFVRLEWWRAHLAGKRAAMTPHGERRAR